MENATEVISRLPAGVQKIIGFSFDYFIGLVGDGTVLKYPHEEKNGAAYDRLLIEAEFYRMLQPENKTHDRIIQFKRVDKDGIYLEYAPNGSISKYLADKTAPPSVRLLWALQAAEGMAYIHQQGVLHCDVNCNNLLLDKYLGVKYVDFQGRHYGPDGRTVLLNGCSEESSKSYMPREGDYANCNTDIFALGSAIYYMLTGEEPFVELDNNNDETEIAAKWSSGEFPKHTLLGDVRPILVKCWSGAYLSASELVVELESLVIKGSNPAE